MKCRRKNVGKVAMVTLPTFCPHCSNGVAVLPAVRLCKDAISDEVA